TFSKKKPKNCCLPRLTRLLVSTAAEEKNASRLSPSIKRKSMPAVRWCLVKNSRDHVSDPPTSVDGTSWCWEGLSLARSSATREKCSRKRERCEKIVSCQIGRASCR